MTVRTRFAPSPTGTLHLGSVRTALFCWLYARHCGGDFVLRIEDTDRKRSTDENVQAILDGMNRLGLDFDEGPIFQTARFERYQEVIEDWLATGKAYYCYCTPEELEEKREQLRQRGEHIRYDGTCRDGAEPREGIRPVVRFKNPLSGEVVVDDAVKGRVVFQNEQLDDLIIARSDGTPTYNFTVVVDDSDMGISHVIRGDDHLNNTPRQINMMTALGADLPTFAHLPMILGEDGAKLSKRHGAVDIRDYLDEGYLPSALLNYLVRLGWSHGDQEVFTLTEMQSLFDIANVNPAASSFNPEKLRWLNQQHIMAAEPGQLVPLLAEQFDALDIDVSNGPKFESVIEVHRERAVTLRDLAESSRYYFEDFDAPDAAAAKKHLRPVILEPLESVTSALTDLGEWSPDAISAAVQKIADERSLGFGKLGQPIRVAVSGGGVSPPIDRTLSLVGKTRSIERLNSALDFVRKRAEAG